MPGRTWTTPQWLICTHQRFEANARGSRSPRLQLVLQFSTVSMVVRGGPRTNAVIVTSWPGPLKPTVSPARVHPDVAARAHVPKFRPPSHSTGLLASTAPSLCPLLVITTWLVVHGPVSVPRAPV
jgi:hypothetical protein